MSQTAPVVVFLFIHLFFADYQFYSIHVGLNWQNKRFLCWFDCHLLPGGSNILKSTSVELHVSLSRLCSYNWHTGRCRRNSIFVDIVTRNARSAAAMRLVKIIFLVLQIS